MKHNLSNGSRWRRMVLGLALIPAAVFNIFGSEILSLIVYAAAIYLLATAILRFCLIYRILGINVSKSNSRNRMY